MRQLVKAAAILAGMLVFSGALFAQCKITVVNMQDAVVGSNEGQVNAKKFDARTVEWTGKIEKMKTDIETLTTKRKQQQALGSQSVLADLDKQIDTKTKDLTRLTEDAQNDVNDYRDQLLAPVMMTAQVALEGLATEKNFSLVYDISAPNSPIVYAAKDCNVTEELKKRMNAKAAAAPATAGAAAPTPKPPTPKQNPPVQNPPPAGTPKPTPPAAPKQ